MPRLVGVPQPTAAVGAGEPVDAVCPDGQVMVGFSGRAGQQMDAIALRCAPLRFIEGALTRQQNISDGPVAEGADGGGDAFPQADCRFGVAIGIFGSAGDALEGFGLNCGEFGCR